MAQTQIRGSTQIIASSITSAKFANATITTSQISNSAAILGSQLSSTAAIAGTQLSSSAAIIGTQFSSTAAILSTQLSSSANILGSQLSASAAIANSQLATTYIQASGTTGYTGNQNHGGFTITNVGTPSNTTDAANKAYVDAVSSGLKIKFARVVSGSAITTLSGLLVVDSYTTVAGDIVLLTAQATGSQNGFWQVASGAWTRPAIYATGTVFTEGMYSIIAADGTSYKNTKWFCTNTASFTVDTTATTWLQDNTGVTYVAGSGISLTSGAFATTLGNGVGFDGSNKVQAIAKDTSLTVSSTGINITPGTAGQLLLTNSGATAAAMVSLTGDVTLSTAGAASVNNVAGSGFLKYTNIITLEVVSGTVNSSNTSFTIANTPQGNIRLYWDGILLNPGTGNDYTISGSTITTLFTPTTGDVLLASYVK
jgi:hypothetical protein